MIDFQNVSKHFGTQDVLIDACFRINPGERIGIVGPNGTGKSTVVDLIAGEISPDNGTVTLPNNCRIGYLHQQLKQDDSHTPLLEFAENAVPGLVALEKQIEKLETALSEKKSDQEKLLARLGDCQTDYEHLGGYEIRHKTEAALSGLGFAETSFSRDLSEFSGGWQMRASLARCLVGNPDILLLDEPSNYLDIPAIEWLQRYLRDFNGTLILISHDRYLLNTLTTSTLEVANTHTEKYKGNYDHYAKERTLRYEQRLSAQKNQDKKREHTERFIERFRSQATKATQVKSKIKMLERMDEVRIPQQIVSKGKIRISRPSRCGHEVIRLEESGLTYNGEDWVLRKVDLRIERGEKIALVGLNGMGKTTLLRILSGELDLSEGKRVLGHKVIVGYQSQEFADTMSPSSTVFNTVRSVASDLSDGEVRSLLGGFGFSGDAVDKQVSVLSGGEKVRLAFARLLIRPPNLLLLDEPTTHLDIAAREALEEALKSYQGTLCIVSHDIEFVRNVATSIIGMIPQGIERFNGAYDDYKEWIEGRKNTGDTSSDKNRKQQTESTGLDKKALRKQRAEERKATASQKRKLKKIISRAENQIEVFEKEQIKLTEELSSENPETSFEEINRRLSFIQNEISNYTRKWEEAAMEIEEMAD